MVIVAESEELKFACVVVKRVKWPRRPIYPAGRKMMNEGKEGGGECIDDTPSPSSKHTVITSYTHTHIHDCGGL